MLQLLDCTKGSAHMTPRQLAQHQRRELLAREQAIANQIDSAYSLLWQSLARQLLRLLDDMQRAEQRAKAFNQPFDALRWIRQIRGLDMLLASVEQDMQTFTATARALVQSQWQPFWFAGEQDAIRLLDEALPGIGVQFGRPSLRAFDVLASRGAAHLKIAELFARLTPEAKEAVRKRLLAGLALGQGPREVARSIAAGVRNLSRNRALVIARTELISAYRDANLATYRENSDVVKEWEWSTAEDERTCPLCQPMDGKRFPLNQPFDAKHASDRCTPVPVTYGYEEILARFAA